MSKVIEYACIVLLIGGMVHNQIWYNDLDSEIRKIRRASAENKEIANRNTNAAYVIELASRAKLREIAIELGHGNWGLIRQLEKDIEEKEEIKKFLDDQWDIIMRAEQQWEQEVKPKMDKAFKNEDIDKYYALMKERDAYHQQLFTISDSSSALFNQISALYNQIDSLEAAQNAEMQN